VPVIVVRGDARHLPLPDASVDLIVTSPPYFWLRSYRDAGQHYGTQIGLEATPRQYVAALLDCTREWMRVLKPEGNLFVNLGDKYSQYEGTRKGHGRNLASPARSGRGEPLALPVNAPGLTGIPVKSLNGLPWRYALGCTDELGLILRRDIIFSKLNGMPESQTDRARSTHEYMFHLVKQPRYYTAVDEIREPHQPQSLARATRNRFAPDRSQDGVGVPNTLDPAASCHSLGRLPGSVWDIATQPLISPECRLVWGGRTVRWFATWEEGRRHMRTLARDVDGFGAWGRPSLRPEDAHYAAFPCALVRPVILGWSPRGICTACDQGRRPVTDTRYVPQGDHDPRAGREKYGRMEQGSGDLLMGRFKPQEMTHGRADAYVTITEHACDCPDTTAPARPAVVVDPFGGTGTTALVAAAYGRTGITVDRSHSYSRLARWRTTDPGERAKAMLVRKPPPAPDHHQGTLFDMESI